MKKIFAAVLASVGLTAAAPSSAVVVGGVDFGVLGGPPFNTHFEVATLAETFVANVGDTLQGYGLVTNINGNTGTNYCAGGGNCAIYYYFHDYTVKTFNGSNVAFTGGVVDLYYSNAAPANLLNQSSAANVAFITGLTPWVSLTGHTFYDAILDAVAGFDGLQTLNGAGTLTGGTLSQSGQGQADVDTSGAFGIAAVAAFLDGNAIPDALGGFSDLIFTTSSNNTILNPFDLASSLADSCRSQPEVGDWCLAGSLDARGTTVIPEPGTLAMLGLALFGIGVARTRRKQS